MKTRDFDLEIRRRVEKEALQVNPKIEEALRRTLQNPQTRQEARKITRRSLALALAAAVLVCGAALALSGLRPSPDRTVTALRQRAAEVVEGELMRLESRLPGLDSPQRDEVARTVRRVVDKLLHSPTVRVKQLATTPGGDSYAAALRELFELSPGAVEAVASPVGINGMELVDDFTASRTDVQKGQPE